MDDKAIHAPKPVNAADRARPRAHRGAQVAVIDGLPELVPGLRAVELFRSRLGEPRPVSVGVEHATMRGTHGCSVCTDLVCVQAVPYAYVREYYAGALLEQPEPGIKVGAHAHPRREPT